MSSLELIDPSRCIARLLKDPTQQCKYKRKRGDFCATHSRINNISRIPDPIGLDQTAMTDFDSYSNHVYREYPIIRIQSVWRGYRVRRQIRLQGIASICRHLLKNDSDFLTFESINEISPSDLFTFRDDARMHWGFHVATFQEFIKTSQINPYNTLPLLPEVLQAFTTFLRFTEQQRHQQIQIQIAPLDTSPSFQLQQHCIQVFQKMDALKQYTQCEWFLDLHLHQYKKLYQAMEDLWHYRLPMSREERKRYIPHGDVFSIPIFRILRMANKYEVATLLLTDFNRLVSEGITEADRTTAALWILSGLTMVSYSARNALPWLFQSAYYHNE